MTLEVDFTALCCAAMQERDLDQVLAIEQNVYPYPWSRGNLVDSLPCKLSSEKQAWVVRDRSGQLLGYYFLLLMYDEAHLLNLAVCADMQGQGLGRFLLDQALACARGLKMASLLLEVRPSNTRALAMYQRQGFVQIGLRKGYYPAGNLQREDALVMRRIISVS